MPEERTSDATTAARRNCFPISITPKPNRATTTVAKNAFDSAAESNSEEYAERFAHLAAHRKHNAFSGKVGMSAANADFVSLSSDSSRALARAAGFAYATPAGIADARRNESVPGGVEKEPSS